MKRILLIVVALVATMTAIAQNIAVVSPSNATTIYQTLDDAINSATNGSTIYLPGGGFQIKDETTIAKKITIMGVSHRGDTDNVDGATIISGRLNFLGGSSGSAVVGVFISGNIDVGNETDAVENLTIRFCNINSIQVHNSNSVGMYVNQCYLRNTCSFGNCNVRLENNIVHSLFYINGGTVNHNIVTSQGAWTESGRYSIYTAYGTLRGVANTSIKNNFFLEYSGNQLGGNCQLSNNCIGTGSMGDEPIIIDEGKTWDDVFTANKGVSIYSDYHLKGNWGKNAATDGSDIGIFGGSGFDPDALAPIPRIVSKKVAEQSDGSGKLRIEVTVKAN